MGRKKNKVPKITEEEYYAYVAGLRSDGVLLSADGKLPVPEPFVTKDKNEKPKLGR